MEAERVEHVQRAIAEAMGVPWERYAARAIEGVQVASHWEDEYPPRCWWKRLWWTVEISCSRDRPSFEPTMMALSELRVDRRCFPHFVPIPDAERRVDARTRIPDSLLVPEGGEFHAMIPEGTVTRDIARLVIRTRKWRAVVALLGRFSRGRLPRFGLDFVGQRGLRNWRQLTVRFYSV